MIIVREAAQADVDPVKRIADACQADLGFVLRPALEAAVGRGWLLVATDHRTGDVVAFAHFRHRRDDTTTLYEIAVEAAHRRRGVGRALIGAVLASAARQGKRRLRLKCPTDNASNAFYEALGFALGGVEPGRKRPLNIWSRRTAQEEARP